MTYHPLVPLGASPGEMSRYAYHRLFISIDIPATSQHKIQGIILCAAESFQLTNLHISLPARYGMSKCPPR